MTNTSSKSTEFPTISPTRYPTDSYYYVLTDAFPFIPRYFQGFPTRLS